MTANGFINIPRAIWRSPEVEHLSVPAKLILVEFHYRFTGANNGAICLPYLDVQARHRMSSKTVCRAIRELKDAGLVETTISGSFDHKAGARKGMGSKYRLTYLP